MRILPAQTAQAGCSSSGSAAASASARSIYSCFVRERESIDLLIMSALFFSPSASANASSSISKIS